MANTKPVLVLECIDGVNILKIETIENDKIPETLNGESGFHVYHVRMLTELILKQLKKTHVRYALDDDEIIAISIASSLHDIGKTMVPKSILEFPGKLSPVEYDIVKKHAAFGAEMIAEAQAGGVAPEIVRHAKEIARSHHERYDGTGYPDALIKDAIPLSAQVVSLADAFDALTSARSYKQAFSQDVAIEMIANGMCGVFNAELVECLLQVVNNKVLVDIRDRVKKARSVVADPTVFIPKKVLLIGNTGYVTQEFIDETFFNSHVTIAGESGLKSGPGLKVFRVQHPPVQSIFETYDFDIIVYFAAELNYYLSEVSDAEDLRTALNYTQKTQKDTKFLYLSSLDAAFEEKTDRGLLSASKESLCEFYAKKYALDLKIVRIPYLYSGTKPDDFLHTVFDRMIKRQNVQIDESAAARCYFLSMYDLSELVARLLDNWNSGGGILTINDEFKRSFSDLYLQLTALYHGARMDFTGEAPSKTLTTNNKALRNEYGWFSKISILTDLEEQFDRFLAEIAPRDLSRWERMKAWVREHTLTVKIAELFALFILTEILLQWTGSSVMFSIVDFRMAYIVIMATVHGLKFGIAAAGLSSASWFLAKILSGTKWLTIFYEPTNWLAFVFYFFVGALCGYIRLKSDDKSKFLTEENELLEEKLVFTRELYTDTFNEKRDLKKQIIGSKDSFGKIFDATRNLDTVEPRALYLRIMDTFENILENKSISVYSVNESSAFGRLEVASRDIIGEAARSIALDVYQPIIEQLGTREIWKNTRFEPEFPMYAAGVYRGGKLELLIFIWHAQADQRSLYYVNLFKIMRDLVQMSLLRAYDYHQAVYEKQYLSGTHILNAEAFEKSLEHFRQLAERKVFSYVQLTVDCRGHDYADVDAMLDKRIRANDIVGVTEDGALHILLSQATKEDLSYVLPRFENLDIKVNVSESK